MSGVDVRSATTDNNRVATLIAPLCSLPAGTYQNGDKALFAATRN